MNLESLFVLARVKNPDVWMLWTVIGVVLFAVVVAVVSLWWRDKGYANDPALAKHAKRDAKKALQRVVFAIVVGVLTYVLLNIFIEVASQ
jgi:hypothetical protein